MRERKKERKIWRTLKIMLYFGKFIISALIRIFKLPSYINLLDQNLYVIWNANFFFLNMRKKITYFLVRDFHFLPPSYKHVSRSLLWPSNSSIIQTMNWSVCISWKIQISSLRKYVRVTNRLGCEIWKLYISIDLISSPDRWTIPVRAHFYRTTIKILLIKKILS